MIVPLQYLRGIAALMVVYHHAAFQLVKANSTLNVPLAGTGAAGVDIFFVISGFIMWVTTRSATMTPFAFLYRRVIRIVPLYWAVTFLLLAVAAVNPGLLGATTFDPAHALLSLFFVPAPHPYLTGEILPFFIQGWTLNYEMFFYAIFALAMALGRRSMFALIVAMLTACVLIGMIWEPRNTILKFYSSTLLFEFVGGMLLGWIYLRNANAPRAMAIPLILAGSAALLLAESAPFAFGPNGVMPERALVWGLPGLALVAGAVFLAGPSRSAGSGPLWWLGEASYSLYLTHLLTLPAISLLWRGLGFGFQGAGGVLYLVVAITLSALAACLIFVAFERPFTALLRHGRSGQIRQMPPAPI